MRPPLTTGEELPAPGTKAFQRMLALPSLQTVGRSGSSETP